MGNRKYLKEILENKAFIPRYSEEDISYLSYGKFKLISFPMVCFCDIRLSRVKSHLEFYGNPDVEERKMEVEDGYGIGMSKEWGIKKGIQPLQYINEKSGVIDSLKKIFKKILEDEKLGRKEVEVYSNHIIKSLMFMKPLYGIMTRNGKELQKNFQDEQEWRYVPNENKIEEEFLLIGDKREQAGLYNEWLKDERKYKDKWLEFNYSDIEYIILPNEQVKKEFTEFLMNNLSIDIYEKIDLASKFITIERIRSDF